jgi:hypothetical protein
MVNIPKKDFIEEHTHLIKLLRKFKAPSLRKEAASQAAELKHVKGGAVGSKEDAKALPDNYPSDVLDVLEKMTMKDGLNLVGSNALRSQLYAGDYDGYEVVSVNEKTDEAALVSLRKRFQQMVAGLVKDKKIFVGDIKAGIVPEWVIIPSNAYLKKGKVVGLDVKKAKMKVDALLHSKIITPEEAKAAFSLLKPRMTPVDFLKAQEELKYHVLRWTPDEIKKNKKVLRDGTSITLEEAFHTPAITKIDTIALVQNNRYTDFSVIYEFENKGKTLNPAMGDIGSSLAQDVEAYKATGNYFKALKRQYALAKYTNNVKKMEALTTLLNSDLGRLYQIAGDMKTLADVVRKAPIDVVKYEVDQFKNRLANIYNTPSYTTKEPLLLKSLKRIVRLPKEKMAEPLIELSEVLSAILQKETKKYL